MVRYTQNIEKTNKEAYRKNKETLFDLPTEYDDYYENTDYTTTAELLEETSRGGISNGLLKALMSLSERD